jgi:hypothetical protein
VSAGLTLGLFRPLGTENDFDEVLACEAGDEVGENVVIHRPEGGVGAVFHAVGEGLQDVLLEVRPLVRGGDRADVLGPDLVEVEAEHVGLDAGGDEGDLGPEVFGDAGCGVQGDAQPDGAGLGLSTAVLEQEVAGEVGAVDLEPLVGAAVAFGES